MMKNTKRIFICALCIILSVIVASATLMAGATDVINESTTAASSAEATEKTTIPATEVISTTEKPIEDSIKDFVSENDLQDDLNEIGGGIKSFSASITEFFENLIKGIETASERIVEFLKQVFRVASFD